MKNHLICSIYGLAYSSSRHFLSLGLLIIMLFSLTGFKIYISNEAETLEYLVSIEFFILSTWVAVFIGVLIPLLIDVSHYTDVALTLSKFNGTYKRIDIGQDNAPDEELIGIRSKNNNLLIILELDSDMVINVDAEYWKEQEEDSVPKKVKGKLMFDFDRPIVARGSYRYVDADDAGHYDLSVVYEGGRTLLYVRYQRLFPDPQLADKVKGWEIWERVSDKF